MDTRSLLWRQLGQLVGLDSVERPVPKARQTAIKEDSSLCPLTTYTSGSERLQQILFLSPGNIYDLEPWKSAGLFFFIESFPEKCFQPVTSRERISNSFSFPAVRAPVSMFSSRITCHGKKLCNALSSFAFHCCDRTVTNSNWTGKDYLPYSS